MNCVLYLLNLYKHIVINNFKYVNLDVTNNNIINNINIFSSSFN